MVMATVSSNVVVLVGAVFLASAVEMVEALTIVVAVGHTQGWRSALEGAAVAIDQDRHPRAGAPTGRLSCSSSP